MMTKPQGEERPSSCSFRSSTRSELAAGVNEADTVQQVISSLMTVLRVPWMIEI